MRASTDLRSPQRSTSLYPDFVHTGPGTVAGRYMRLFWQPVYYSEQLRPGRAVPIRVMGEDFTLYRSQTGTAHLVGFRCPHRGTQLSTGWVEGDAIRCFYHGWKFDGSGQCIQQPAERESFARKVSIPSYPTQEYLGMIFAYLGEGEPPEMPRYREFEEFDGVLEISDHAWIRKCNFFNNVENNCDSLHLGFVHRVQEGSFDGTIELPTISYSEAEWGILEQSEMPGRWSQSYIVMPNVHYLYTLPYDIGGKAPTLLWWVPIDDESFQQYGVSLINVRGEEAERYRQRTKERRAKRDLSGVDVAEAVLAGRLDREDVDPQRVFMVEVQDHIAQVGQGRIADRSNERLGASDVGVILLRKIWTRELNALAAGLPCKKWRVPDTLRLPRLDSRP